MVPLGHHDFDLRDFTVIVTRWLKVDAGRGAHWCVTGMLLMMSHKVSARVAPPETPTGATMFVIMTAMVRTIVTVTTSMVKKGLIMDVIVGVRSIVVTFGERSTSLVGVGRVVFTVE